MSDPVFPEHSTAFRLRRLANWLPMGFAYGFLYMGRYNLTVAKSALGDVMTKKDFGLIFAIGAAVYGVSFLANGALVDKIGGRKGILIGVFGAMAANFLMGLVLYGRVHWGWELPIVGSFALLYGLNMYFQSYGAVSIVTVKAPWFHVRERGTFSTIFGILIAAGIYFAFDWGSAVVDATRAVPKEDLSAIAQIFAAVFGLGGTGVDQNWMIFFVPSIFMGVFWLLMFLLLRNTPGEAGFPDFDTAEASLSDDGKSLPVFVAYKKVLTHPVLLWVCLIEFCSGVMRNGVINWYDIFSKEVGFHKQFVLSANWGLTLLVAGVLGANATGWISDRMFHSRRAPMSGVSYALMIAACAVMIFTLGANYWFAGLATVTVATGVIAVHGILSGTATADFGGIKNTGKVVGIVDGVVYLGTAVQSLAIGMIVPTKEAAKDPANWWPWPAFLLPFAILGFFFTLKIWHALPDRAKKR